LWSVVKGGKKELIAELFGALSLGGAAASIVLAAGHSYVQALALWVALAVRAMTSVIYVREQLRYHRGDAHDFRTVISVHVAGFALLLVLMAAHLVKPLICFAAFLLLARLCFMHERSVISAKALGLRESALGIIYVVLLLLAFSH
jgi:hypothetical protein